MSFFRRSIEANSSKKCYIKSEETKPTDIPKNGESHIANGCDREHAPKTEREKSPISHSYSLSLNIFTIRFTFI